MILFFTLVVLGLLIIDRRILQRKLSVVEHSLAETCGRLEEVEKARHSELTQEQEDYRDKVQAQYGALFCQMKEQFSKAIRDCEAGLRKELEAAFVKACDEINFKEIEYKKTITKKRKQFNRQHGKDAKPQRIWRYIDEE